MTKCNHVAKVIKWKLDENYNYAPAKYGCTKCDQEFFEMPKTSFVSHSHTEFVEGCFGCKVETLQMSTGDANGNYVRNGWTGKKWDKELQLYRDARKQGIQPDGTSTAKIQKALDISDKTGKAYGS